MTATIFLYRVLLNLVIVNLLRLRGIHLTKSKEESQEMRCAHNQLRESNSRVQKRILRNARSRKSIQSSRSIESLSLSAVTVMNSTMPTECAKIVIMPKAAQSWQQSVSTKTVLCTHRAFARTATWVSITKRREATRRFQLRSSSMLPKPSPPK